VFELPHHASFLSHPHLAVSAVGLVAAEESNFARRSGSLQTTPATMTYVASVTGKLYIYRAQAIRHVPRAGDQDTYTHAPARDRAR
jgi:hypothetical protein